MQGDMLIVKEVDESVLLVLYCIIDSLCGDIAFIHLNHLMMNVLR